MPSNPNKPFADGLRKFRSTLFRNISAKEGVPKTELYLQLRQECLSKKEADEIIETHIELGWLKKEGSMLYAIEETQDELSERRGDGKKEYENPEPYEIEKDKLLTDEEAMNIIDNA